MSDTISTWVARRPNQISPGQWRNAGQLLPEAHLWSRPDSNMHAGFIGRVEVSVAALRDAVDRFCPEQAEAIYDRLGVTPPAAAPSEPEPEPDKRSRRRAPAKAAAAKE